MPKLKVTIKTKPPLSALAADVKTVVVKINTAPVRLSTVTADVSQTPNNIITQKPDGLYATINHAPTIQTWITAFNDNLT